MIALHQALSLGAVDPSEDTETAGAGDEDRGVHVVLAPSIRVRILKLEQLDAERLISHVGLGAVDPSEDTETPRRALRRRPRLRLGAVDPSEDTETARLARAGAPGRAVLAPSIRVRILKLAA